MTNKFDSIDDALNTKCEIVKSEDKPAELALPNKSDQDLTKDYEYRRANLY